MNPNADYKKYALQVTLLILVAVAAFSNIMQNKFVWDDETLITENPYVKELGSIPYFFTSHYWSHSHPGSKGGYRPIFMATLALDYHIWGGNASGFHLTSIILHMANVVLVFMLAVLLVKASRYGPWFCEAPFIAALLFAVHPVHVESVTYIKNRGDLLACVFLLIALILFIRNVPRKGLRANAAALSVSVFCFITALLSKEITVTLPLILLLYIMYALPARERRAAAFKTLPYFGVTALYMISKFPFLAAQMISRGAQKIGIYSNALVILKSLAYYLVIMINPINLNAERRLPFPGSFFEPGILFSFALLAVVVAAAVVFFRRSRLLGFSLLWILITLLPSSNIILLYPRPIAEQRLYLPSIGFCLALALIINKLFLPSSAPNPRKKAALCALLIILITVFYSVLTMRRNLYWRDPVTFWTKTSESAPYGGRAHYNAGCAYLDEGKISRAVESFKKAISINQNFADAYYNLGIAYYTRKEFDRAMASYKKAVEIDPRHIKALVNLNALYQLTGRTDEAVSFYRKIIGICPDNGIIYNNLAAIYEENLGKHEDAIELYKKAIRQGFKTPEVYYNLGVAYHSLGMSGEAMKSYREAIRLKADFAEAYNNIAVIYYGQGRNGLAARYDAKAKSLRVSGGL